MTLHKNSPDSVLLVVLVIFSATLYCVDPNNDWVGWNDLYSTREAVNFAEAFLWTPDDLASVSSFLAKLALIAHSFVFYPHGPIPPLYFGVFYGVLELIGVPFTVFLIQVPVALLGAVTVVLLYRVLRRDGVSTGLAVAATLLLVFSPIFMGNSRSIGSYWAVAIPFVQVLALFALQRLDTGGRGRWLVGFAFLNIMLSDVLSFLVFMALLTAFLCVGIVWWRRTAEFKASVRRMVGRAGLLSPWPVWIPTILEHFPV